MPVTPLLEPDDVVRAHACQHREFFPPQPRHPPRPLILRETEGGGRHPLAPGPKKLAEAVAVVHADHSRHRAGHEGAPVTHTRARPPTRTSITPLESCEVADFDDPAIDRARF